MMLVMVYFPFSLIVTALIEYSCLRGMTNKLYGQSLVSVRNTQ